jgi:uncharacterized membrane protein YgcG
VADYEKCGQHCCCRQFLKVLKPVSIKSAKVQKATLDPLKISGRCGRLMCCLRYEDETYDELVKRLPKLKKRVGTRQGAGLVIDRQILTQLVLVRLEHNGTEIAVPVEEIIPPEEAPVPGGPGPGGPVLRTGPATDPLRGMPAREVERRVQGDRPPGPGAPPPPHQQKQRDRWQHEQRAKGPPREPLPGSGPAGPPRPTGSDADRPASPAQPPPPREGGEPGGEGRRRRRRRKRGGGGGAFGGGGSAFG